MLVLCYVWDRHQIITSRVDPQRATSRTRGVLQSACCRGSTLDGCFLLPVNGSLCSTGLWSPQFLLCDSGADREGVSVTEGNGTHDLCWPQISPWRHSDIIQPVTSSNRWHHPTGDIIQPVTSSNRWHHLTSDIINGWHWGSPSGSWS